MMGGLSGKEGACRTKPLGLGFGLGVIGGNGRGMCGAYRSGRERGCSSKGS
jgi:hypothetical protein